jgi:hypothetical protein
MMPELLQETVSLRRDAEGQILRDEDGHPISDSAVRAMTAEEVDALRAGVPAFDALAYAADARWRREIGGITVAGIPVATDDRSKLLIDGARRRVDLDPSLVTPWAVGTQVFELTAAQIIALSDAVGDHVAGCFAVYAAVVARIHAGTITTAEEIDDFFA